MTWKDELRKIPAPEPSQNLLERILASRAAGVRVRLPAATARSAARWRVSVLLAAAAAIVLWVGRRSPVSQEGSGALERDPIWEMPFSPAEALGQETVITPAAPRYSLVTELRGRQVQAGSWHYTSCSTTDDVLTKCGGRETVTIRQSAWSGAPAWLLSRSRESVRDWLPTRDTVRSVPDSAYFARDDLRPLYRRIRGLRFSLVQHFDRDSVQESFDRTGRQSRHWRVSAALPGLREAPLLLQWADVNSNLLLQALPFARRWRGSVYSVGLLGAPPRVPPFVPVDFRVVGTGRVDVPAGRFECWKLEVREGWNHDRPATLWVSKDRGWVIKTERRGSDWRNESVLTAYEAATPPTP
jgi:hypothetical protein